MRRVVATGLCLIAVVAFGQSPSDSSAEPAFEVASVRPAAVNRLNEASRQSHVHITPGGLSMRNISVSECMQWAYDTTEFQIEGKGWLERDRFDILAKAAEPVKEDQLKLMLKALLADRFKLQFHRETKVMQVYLLVPARNGSKLHPSTLEGEGEPVINPIRGKQVIGVQKTSIAMLARMISDAVNAPVLDQTGLKGNFDFTVDLTGFDRKNMQKEDARSAVFTVLQEQLGLKLEPKKSPVEILIVDAAERVPTEN